MDSSSPSSPEDELVETKAATVCSNGRIDGVGITESEIFMVQRKWATGVLKIGSLFLSGDDYVTRTHSLIDTLYGYDEGPVLFKPTLAVDHPFRPQKNEATSYFIGGAINEDLGFAIRPWERVRFGSQRILLQDTTALCMGHYYFTEYNLCEAITAEFSFGYFRSKDGSVRINLHHSSLPYIVPKH